MGVIGGCEPVAQYHSVFRGTDTVASGPNIIAPCGVRVSKTEASRHEASLEAAIRRLSALQAAFIAAEAGPGQKRALVETEAQKRRYLIEVMAEVWWCLDHHLSLLLSSHEMVRSDITPAFLDYLWPVFEAVRNRTVAFCSLRTRQVENHGEALRQSAPWIVSYLDHRFWSSAAVSNSGLMIYNPCRPGCPSSLYLVAQRIVFDSIQ